jgi:DnaK suppressor protein
LLVSGHAGRGSAEEEDSMTPAQKAPAASSPAKAVSRAVSRAGRVLSGKAVAKRPAKTAAPAKKAPVKKAAAKKAPVKKAPAKKAPVKKAPVKKAPVKKAPVTKAATKAPAPVVAPKPAKKVATKPKIGPYANDAKFLEEQRILLEAERAVYRGQATDLKAEADSLAQEREPGDVQFDEESGEGGTVTVDRERDLAMAAQALAIIGEMDDALGRIADRTYGSCERCHQPIPKARLRALPYARLCVACKSGGLSRR